MNEFSFFPITFSIIALTVLVSYLALNNEKLRDKLLFYPYGMQSTSEYYRFVSHGFIHGGYVHLILNMYVLYSFGRFAETRLFNKTEYLVFYLSALAVSSIFDFAKNKSNPGYAALGASGAVSAVLFSTIIFDPWEQGVALFGILPITNIVFAAAFLFYCYYMDKKGNDNIGHSAHMWGSIYGFVFTGILNPGLLKRFFEQLMHPNF